MIHPAIRNSVIRCLTIGILTFFSGSIVNLQAQHWTRARQNIFFSESSDAKAPSRASAAPVNVIQLYNGDYIDMLGTGTGHGILRGHPSISGIELGSVSNDPLWFITNSTERMRIQGNGNVAIGTTSADTARLLIVGNSGNTGNNGMQITIPGVNYGLIHLGWGTTYDDYIRSGPAGKVILQDTGGSVGIGTSNPGYRLDVQGGLTSSTSGFISKNNPWSTADSAFFPNGITTAGSANWIYGGTTFIGNAPSNGWGHQFQAANGASHAYLAIGGGNVGIGTTNPNYRLDVNGEINATGLRINGTPISGGGGGASTAANVSAGQFGANTGGGNYAFPSAINVNGGSSSNWAGLNVGGTASINAAGNIYSYSRICAGNGSGNCDAAGGVVLAGTGSNAYGNIYLTGSGNTYFNGGNVGIGTNAPGQKLDVYGNINVSGPTGSGNIYVSGNINAKYQDVAEWVPSSEKLTSGTVVVLDATKSNQVVASSTAYDTRVAGVISAQPGITLGEKTEDKVLVATTGRVRVKVDATKSPINIGDLLVTSDNPGVAMKSEAVNLGSVQIHRPGTIIGKALEPLAKGKGEILVLLSLQ